MLFSTILFFTILIVVNFILHTKDSGIAKFDLSQDGIDEIFCSDSIVLVRNVVFVLLLMKGIVLTYILFVTGASYSVLRGTLDLYIPMFISYPLDIFISTFYPLIIVRLIVKNASWGLLVCTTGLFFIVFSLSGSRSFSLYVIFCTVFLLYMFRKVSKGLLLLSGVVSCLLVGVISYIRLSLSMNDYTLIWYKTHGIILENSMLLSVYNLVLFQIRDIGVRTSEIFSFVPAFLPYQYGKSLFFGFYSMLPGKQINPAVAIHHMMVPFSSSSSTPYPPTTIAQFYLDFGLLGVVLGACVISYISFKLTVNIKKYPTPINIAIYLQLIYFLLLSLYGDFESYRFVVGSIFLAVLFFITSYDIKLKKRVR